MTRSIAVSAFPVAFALLLSGCLGPAYHRPEVATGDSFKEVPAASSDTWKPASPSDALPREGWWTVFADTRLNDLEARVLTGNQTLAQAKSQYAEALELVAIQRASWLPTVTVAPSATRQRNFTPSTGNRSVTNTFDLPATAAWEPDFWGTVAKSVDSAKEAAQASAASLENAKLSLQSQLAIDYFSLEELDAEEALLIDAIQSYDKALALTQVRFSAGIASQADVAQAKTQLDSTKAQAEDVALNRAKFEHAIAVLVGVPPSAFTLSSAPLAGIPPSIPVALPSQLLERRPDVAAAERQTASANSNVGLARTAFFPAITLSATGGYESASFAQWVMWPTRVWALGASASETIFDFGRHRAQYRQVKDAYDGAVAAYRQTALGAFQQVEDDLASLSWLAREGLHQDDAARSAEESLKLETERYKGGLVSYLDVITTQNIALNAERTAAQVLGRRMEAAVALVRDIGGGWDSAKLPYGVPPAPPAPKH
jgi:NodT family efflux transporter outer membrane factor (OMF) lipoprotein